MTMKQAVNLKKKLEENGAEEVSLYEGYSGRCMYGETTVGVVCSHYDVPENHKFKQDELGRSAILY